MLMLAHFNPRSPCGERRGLADALNWAGVISIHAPRVGSDGCAPEAEDAHGNFNPRSPCGERPRCKQRSCRLRDFNPRSPCGERRRNHTNLRLNDSVFQSTLPVWGATHIVRTQCKISDNFNPRSPCGERPRVTGSTGRPLYFNPRSPCGERPCCLRGCAIMTEFQSTLPVWGATVSSFVAGWLEKISIHAPRVGSDDF